MAPTLSEKLKSLGVKVGARDLPAPQPRNPYSIEHVVPGHLQPTQAGDAYVVESTYPQDYQYGYLPLYGLASLQKIAAWSGETGILQCQTHEFLYLDIETTGLSGGTGTYAFLVGVGRFVGTDFTFLQFFMRDPIQEPAHLLALEEFIAPCSTVVSYNGRAFDVPILNTRYITQGWKSPFARFNQIDLLPIARKLWRERMPSRTLGNVETYILGSRRSEEDVPGWMIPQLFFDYLRSGDARPLKNVFYHNAMDVLAITALLKHVSQMLSAPMELENLAGADLIGLGRFHEDLDQVDDAVDYYRRSLACELPEALHWETVRRLSFILKRRGDYPSAIALWQQAGENNHLFAHVELAKYYEHLARDCTEALHWTQQALEVVAQTGMPGSGWSEGQPGLEHRLQRLQKKLGIQ